MGIKTIPANEYVDKLLVGRDRVSTGELQIGGDFDYVMLVMQYDSEESPYRLEIGRYGIPNMVISRK